MQNKGVKKFSRKLCLLLICQSMAKILWLPSTCELDVDPEKKKNKKGNLGRSVQLSPCFQFTAGK